MVYFQQSELVVFIQVPSLRFYRDTVWNFLGDLFRNNILGERLGTSALLVIKSTEIDEVFWRLKFDTSPNKIHGLVFAIYLSASRI